MYTLADIAKHIMDNCIDVKEDGEMTFNYCFLLEYRPYHRKTRSQSGYESIEHRYVATGWCVY